MIAIEARMVRQYEAGKIRLKDPCIICEGKYPECGHEDATPDLIKRIKALGPKGRADILKVQADFIKALDK